MDKYIFSREMVLRLSKLTRHQLTYLHKLGLVEPYREAVEKGNKNNPTFYSFEQLLELRAIYELRQQTSLQKIRNAKEWLSEIGNDQKLANKKLIVVNNEIYLFQNDELDKLIQIAGKNQGQIVINFSISFNDVYQELEKCAKEQSDIIDFEIFREKAKERGFKPEEKSVA